MNKLLFTNPLEGNIKDLILRGKMHYNIYVNPLYQNNEIKIFGSKIPFMETQLENGELEIHCNDVIDNKNIYGVDIYLNSLNSITLVNDTSFVGQIKSNKFEIINRSQVRSTLKGEIENLEIVMLDLGSIDLTELKNKHADFLISSMYEDSKIISNTTESIKYNIESRGNITILDNNKNIVKEITKGKGHINLAKTEEENIPIVEEPQSLKSKIKKML